MESPINKVVQTRAIYENAYQDACFTEGVGNSQVIIKPIPTNLSNVELWVGSNHIYVDIVEARSIIKGLRKIFSLE